MLATVASSTSANRIKRRLNEFGIHSSVIQTPHSITRDGCGYSLRFEDVAKNIVEKTSHELGIKIRAFYLEDMAEDGTKVYIKQ